MKRAQQSQQVVIKRQSKKGIPEPDVHGDLLVLLSQDCWVHIRGLVDDLKAVTSGQWLRDETTLEGYCVSCAMLLLFVSAVIASNHWWVNNHMLVVDLCCIIGAV